MNKRRIQTLSVMKKMKERYIYCKKESVYLIKLQRHFSTTYLNAVYGHGGTGPPYVQVAPQVQLVTLSWRKSSIFEF